MKLATNSSDGNAQAEVVRINVNKIEGRFHHLFWDHIALGHYTGTGDCTAALLLAWIHKTNENISTSLLNTLSTIQSILQLTQQIQHHHVFQQQCPCLMIF